MTRDIFAWIAAAFAVAVFAFFLFGIQGFLAVAAFVMLFIAPFSLVLKNSSLDLEEKLFFSLFIGIGLFPIAVWVVNRFVPSFRLSAVLALGLLAFGGFFWPRISARLKKRQ